MHRGIVGSVLLGIGFLTVFQSALNYVIDTFELYAASAVAALHFTRSTSAAAFPLIVKPSKYSQRTF